MPEYPDPSSRNPLADDCTRCPALVESRECISWGNGPRDADVVVVGEAPGAGDPDADRWKGGNWTGMAYTARHSGRVVRDLLADAGYDDCYYTNAVKCFPSDGAVSVSDANGSSSEGTSDGGSNREPTDAELENCFSHLVCEIRQVDPAAVVTTGKHATRVVLDHEGVTLDGFVDSVLTPVECERLGTAVLPVLHPSYQAVWLARLDYDRDEYVAELGRLLAALL